MKWVLAAVTAWMAGTLQAKAADTPVVAPLLQGSYVTGAIGVNFLSGGNAQDVNRTPPGISFDFNTGEAALFSAGYKWAMGLRAEVELSYRRNGVKDFINNQFPLTGHQEDISVMGNLLYDFHTGTRFTPYAGVGAGLAMLWWRNFESANSGPIVYDRGGSKLAVQGIVGAAYALAPQVELTLDVRYKGSNGYAFKGIQSVDSISDFHLRETTLLAGLRYAF